MSVTYQHGLFVVSDIFRKVHPDALDLIYKHNNEKKIAILNKKLFSQHEYFLEFEQKIINMLSSLKGYKFIKHTTYAFINEEFTTCHITGPRVFPPYSKHIVADPSGIEYYSDLETGSCPSCSKQTMDKVLWGQDLKALSAPIDTPREPIKLEPRDEKLLARLRNIIAMLRDFRTSCLPNTFLQVLQPEDCIDELKVIERKMDSATSEVQKRIESLHWDIANIANVKSQEFEGQMDAKDTSIVTAIESDTTQSVELINQAPSQTNKDPVDYGVRHAITEKEMDTFEQMANRWFPLQQLVWSTQSNGTVLFDQNFPSFAFTVDDFRTSPNAAIFANYRFFRFDIEFEVQVNSSKMQAGALLCSWRYLDQYDEVRNIGDFNDRFLRTQGPHSFAFCGRNSVAKLHVPYKHFFPILAASQGENFTIRDFFRMNILVFNYLRGGDNCNDPVTVNIQMRFINLQKAGLFNSAGIMRGQFDDVDDSLDFSMRCKQYFEETCLQNDRTQEVSNRMAKLRKIKRLSEYDFFLFFYAFYSPLPVGFKYKNILNSIFRTYLNLLKKSKQRTYSSHSGCFFASVRNCFMQKENRLLVSSYIEKRTKILNAQTFQQILDDAISTNPNVTEDTIFDLPPPMDLLQGEDCPDFSSFMKRIIEKCREVNIREFEGQMDNTLGIDVQGGLKGAIRGGLEGLLNQDNSDSNRDKPSDPNQFQPLIPYSSHSWAFGDGTEKTNILRLQPTGQTPHFQPTDEMQTKFVTEIFSGIETFNYRTTDAEGTRIAYYYVNPVAQATQRIITPADEANNLLPTYRVPALGVVASNFAYWKGSMEFRFDFIVPFTNTGRIMIAYIPSYMLNSSPSELESGINYRIAKSCYNAIFDLGEETSITFRAPFYTDRAWLKTDPSDLEISGVVAVFVVNRLVRFCTSSSIVDVNTFVRAGPDFELSVPIKTFLSPSFERSYIPPTTTFRTSNGEGNPAFAGLGDPSSYQESVQGEIYGPVIARDGGSWSNWLTVRPNTNITAGDVFEFGQSKIISWTNSEGVNFMFRYGVPLLNINGVLGDSPALALFETQEGAREFARFQVLNFTFQQGPYTRYYFTATSPRTRDTDGPPSSVVNGTPLDLLDVEMTGQMDDRRAVSIYTTPGELTTHSSSSFFNEKFSDLKTIARRYQFYSDFDSNLNAGTCFGQVIARIPLRPIIRPGMDSDTCAARLYNAVRGGFIANIGSGYRFFKGSLRLKLIFNISFVDPSARVENEDLTFMITHVPDKGALNSISQPDPTLPTSYNPQGYAYYGHSTKVNPICELEIPYYSRYEYITPLRINAQNDLDNLGYLDISLGGTVNKSVKLAIQVYYSFGDDARFSSFQGFPSMVYLGDIPQNPQQATQDVNAQTGQMDSLMKGPTEKLIKNLDSSLENFSNNLTTALQTNVDSLLSQGEIIVGKTCDILESKVEKQQQKFFEKVDVSSSLFIDKLKQSSEDIVQTSMQQCLEVADKMGFKSFGLHWAERLVNIVASVGHVLLNPTLKAAILTFVQVAVNMGLILADKITELFQGLIKISSIEKEKKQEQDGQFECNEAMISSFATIILSAAGLTIGKAKNKSIAYATSGLRLFKDFSLASNSFSTWIKNNLSWITSFLKWAHLVDAKMELNNEIVEKYDSVKEWLTETHRILQVPIHRIEADYNLILKVYTLAWKAESYMTMECTDVGKLPIHHNIRHLSMEICKMRDQLLSSSFSPPIGVEPFVICLAGPPGFGKSELLGVLSDRLIKDIGYKCSGNTSYVRGFTPYWNNAGNQPNVIIDEVGANEETMRQFVTELFSMKSRSVFNPDFAHLEDKRRVFNPISIIMGTNFPFWDVIPTGANSLTALHRRRDALWEVMPDFEGVPNNTIDQMAAMSKKKKEFMSSDQLELDFSHLKFRLCVNPEAETATQAKWNKWITYDEFYRVNLSMFKQHRLKEIKLIKAALDRAYKQRMAFIDGDDKETNGLQQFYDKIMTTPKQTLLAKLGNFNDPSLTATAGKVNVENDDYKTILNNAYKETMQVDEMEGQQDTPKKLRSKACEVRKPVDGPETVEDPVFEAHLNSLIPQDIRVRDVGIDTKERFYLPSDQVDEECPHKIFATTNISDVLYCKDGEKEVFSFAPDFSEESEVPYKRCKKCYLGTVEGAEFFRDWLSHVQTYSEWTEHNVPEEFSGHFKPSSNDMNIPAVKNLEKGRRSLLERFRDFFSKFFTKWSRVFKIISWITLACSIVGLACLVYRKTSSKTEDMKIDNISDTLKILSNVDKFKETIEYKNLHKDDPQLAQSLTRQMLIRAEVVPSDLCGEYAGSVKSYDGSVCSTSSRSSYNSLQRMSAAYRRYVEQGGQSEQLESLISIIQGNLGRIVVEVDGKERLGTNTCGLYDRCAFLMRHQIKTLQALKKAGVRIATSIERNISGKLQRYDFDIDNINFDENSKEELILFKFPKTMPSFRNIIRHIASEKTVVPSSCIMTWVDKRGRMQRQIVQVNRQNYTQCISSDDIVPYKLQYDEAVSYNFGGAGLCGTPLISMTSAPKILGFHCGGLGEKQGSSQRVYQSNFSQEIDGQYGITQEDLCEDEPMVKLPKNLEQIGILKKDRLPGFSTKTQLMKSVMFNEIYESKKVPAPLKKINGVDPMEKALQKFENVPTGFDKRLLKMAYESLRDDLIYQNPPVIVPEETSRLTPEQCFSGIQGFTEYKKINLATSEGYPLNIMGRNPENRYYFGDKKLTTGKHWLFDYDIEGDGFKLKEIHPLLLTERERMNNQRASIINGIDLGERQYAVLTLKDQKMDIEKALSGKNRIFSACPIEQSLSIREYFGHWKAAYMANRIDNSTAIGIDVNGPEWTRLALKLLEKGNNIITGDYSAFGDTLDKDCVKTVFQAINDWFSFYYPNQEQENQIRTALYDELIKMPHIAKNVIFVRQNGIPSGFGLTVELNDCVNKLYMKLAWLSITKTSLREMAQHVYYCMYGDDLIMSVSDVYIDLFNFESIQDFLFQHNITFTPATKDEFSYKSQPLEKSTFLKGNFVAHQKSTLYRPIYLCKLPISSVLELLNWQWKDNDPKTFCFTACRAALQSLHPHGKKEFDFIQGKMLKFFTKHRNTLFGPDDKPDLQTYEELDERFLEQF